MGLHIVDIDNGNGNEVKATILSEVVIMHFSTQSACGAVCMPM